MNKYTPRDCSLGVIYFNFLIPVSSDNAISAIVV